MIVANEGSSRQDRASGIRYQASGIGCQVSGIRHRVSGVRCQVSGVRHQVSGIRCRVSGDAPPGVLSVRFDAQATAYDVFHDVTEQVDFG